jgi:hypothetical protein
VKKGEKCLVGVFYIRGFAADGRLVFKMRMCTAGVSSRAFVIWNMYFVDISCTHILKCRLGGIQHMSFETSNDKEIYGSIEFAQSSALAY